MIEVNTLKSQIISRFLFDEGFNLGEKEEGLPGIKEAVAGCLDAIYTINGKSRELSDTEWHVKPDATPFQKLQAAFRSVIAKGTPMIAEAERGDLVEYYSFLKTQKNEKLKEGRLRFWAALPGADIDLPRLRMCSGNDVETLFNIWIEEHPECLNIKELRIIYQHLDYLPPEIGLFTSLKRLDLSRNGLKELPPEIGCLKSLKRLDLSGNRLRVLPPEIGSLESLKRLDLANNRLEELPPEIGTLSSLLFLCLNRNNLQNGLPPEVGMLSSLKYLEANHCKLKTLPDEIGGLTQLEVLYLLRNQLEELPAEIGKLSRLKHLNADFNCLEKLPPEIGRLSMLEILRLEGNPKLEKLPSEIRDLKNLTLLHLPRGIKEIPYEIGHLTQLENLVVTPELIESLPSEIRRIASVLGFDKRCLRRMTHMGLLANPHLMEGEGA